MSLTTPAPSHHAREFSAPAGVSASVLVLDSHEDSARSLADLLEFCGYQVVVASSGAEALSLASPFDVVITELRLPDMDGYDLVRQMRERAGKRPQLIVAVTDRKSVV